MKNKTDNNINLIHKYKITEEPLDDKYSKYNIPKKMEERIEYYFNNLKKNPGKIIDDLLCFHDKDKKNPLINNFLFTCYFVLGKKKEAEKIANENYKLNPNYLFAKLNLASLYLHKKQHHLIPKLFEYKFDLKSIYPDREIFHFSEARDFHLIFAKYFYYTNEYKQSKMYYKIAKKCGGKDNELDYFFMPLIIKVILFIFIFPFLLIYKFVKHFFNCK